MCIDFSRFLRSKDHIQGDAVLYTRTWILELYFHQNIGIDALSHFVQSHQWCVADQFCDIVCNPGHLLFSHYISKKIKTHLRMKLDESHVLFMRICEEA